MITEGAAIIIILQKKRCSSENTSFIPNSEHIYKNVENKHDNFTGKIRSSENTSFIPNSECVHKNAKNKHTIIAK